MFEVRNGSEAFGVDEQRRTCSCRLWQLSGLPCTHAVSVIFKINRRVEEYVPSCFRKKSFHDAYHQYLHPVGGLSFWPDTSDMSRILPPIPKSMPGRPRKKRIRAAHENKTTNRVSKAGVAMTCSNCQQKGHNKKACKNPTVIVPPKPPAKKGRPRKTTSAGPSLLDEEDLADIPPFVAPQDRQFDEPLVEEQVEEQDFVDAPQATQFGSEQFGDGLGSSSAQFGSDQPNHGVDSSSAQFGDTASAAHFGSEQPSHGVVGLTQKKRVKITKRRGGTGYNKSKVPAARFSRLGRWFGLGERDLESGPTDTDHNAGQTNEDAGQVNPNAGQTNEDADVVNEPVAGQVNPNADAVNPRGRRILNFIKPRGRSERILKQKLAKNVPGIGSSSSNAMDLE